MKHLYTSKRMSRVFGGIVLALAVLLVACGGDSDEAEPTATTETAQQQDAQPTVPPMESTPDSEVSEDEITVLESDIPATAEVSTPETEEVAEAEIVTEESAATTESTPDETMGVATSEVEDAATAETEAETPTENIATAEMADEAAAEATEEPEEDIADEAAEPDSTPEPTVRARTGNETFNHPGDGTGGSGMPGELTSNEEEQAPEATPDASPVAQLEIIGCEVPDVPGFLGESNVFELTADVNFRSGPGVECEPVFDEPIGEGQIVLVLGGPVTQSEDGSEWVQIEVNDETGWISTDFIEPAE